jgi:hypothetical protein
VRRRAALLLAALMLLPGVAPGAEKAWLLKLYPADWKPR